MLPACSRSGRVAGVRGVRSRWMSTASQRSGDGVGIGQHVRALPEGDRYLGFVFSEADSPDEVETAFAGSAWIDVEITAW